MNAGPARPAAALHGKCRRLWTAEMSVEAKAGPADDGRDYGLAAPFLGRPPRTDRAHTAVQPSQPRYSVGTFEQ